MRAAPNSRRHVRVEPHCPRQSTSPGSRAVVVSSPIAHIHHGLSAIPGLGSAPESSSLSALSSLPLHVSAQPGHFAPAPNIEPHLHQEPCARWLQSASLERPFLDRQGRCGGLSGSRVLHFILREVEPFERRRPALRLDQAGSIRGVLEGH